MEEEGATTPFWMPASSGHRRRRSSRSPSSIFLSSGFLIIFLPLTALLFIVFVLPPILSFTSYIFKPNMVKKSWDSLNLVLVLFAIICGFLSRGGGGGSSDMESSVLEVPEESTQRSNHGHWYEERISGYGGMRRMRSSSSYPDLRQESAWVGGDGRWRSFDDTQLDNHRVLGSHRQLYIRRRYEDQDYCEVKNIDVDNTSMISPKEKVLSHIPPRPPSPPPPPPPPPVVKRKVKRSFQAVAREERRETRENSSFESKRVQAAAPPPPPPPPPPPLAVERRSEKSDRKRGGATKEFLTSLYYQRNKKKKQRQKSMENLDTILHNSPHSDQPLRPPPSPPPPPPLPPPPNSVFHNLFSSKKGKSKRFLTVPPPPPPPPPPPASRAYAGKTKTKIALSQSHPYDHPLNASKPPIPEKSSSFNSVDDNPYAGSESLLIPVPPPPPPPPPFKMPDWKFVVHGDYVRIKSTNSSRSGSPDLDYIGSPSSKGPSRSTSLKSETEGGDSAQPLFCPSPDVNTKADTFIARFRAGLKLEKINSIKEKQEVGMSNLGPEPGQAQGSGAVQI